MQVARRGAENAEEIALGISAVFLRAITRAFERFHNPARLFFLSAKRVARQQLQASLLAGRMLRASNLKHVFSRVLCWQNDATIHYEITNLATNKPVLSTEELASKVSPNAEQVTLEKSFPLASLQPGQYQVKIKVNDQVTKQQTEESAKFSVD